MCWGVLGRFWGVFGAFFGAFFGALFGGVVIPTVSQFPGRVSLSYIAMHSDGAVVVELWVWLGCS